MSTSTNNSKISTYRLSGGVQIDQETRHEKAVTLTTDFPYRHNRYNPASMPGRIFPWHWHDEVECFYIRQGNLVYHLQGKEVVFGPGDVGFVNTGILHMTQPGNREACILQDPSAFVLKKIRQKRGAFLAHHASDHGRLPPEFAA